MSAVLKNIDNGAVFGARKKRGRGADPVPSPEDQTRQRLHYRVATPANAVRIANSTTCGHYDGADLRPYEGRPGALDAFYLPSLQAGRRVYPKRNPNGGTV